MKTACPVACVLVNACSNDAICERRTQLYQLLSIFLAAVLLLYEHS